jgi:hypothetical protein
MIEIPLTQGQVALAAASKYHGEFASPNFLEAA